MSSTISFNGSSYIIPSTGDVGWGSNVSNYLIAIAAGCLQKTGGAFTLSAETDFGATYGLKSSYYKSRASNVASTGSIRLANAETGIVWRTALNDGDLPLTVNSSNQLTFNGVALTTASLASSHILVGNASNIATDVAMSGDVHIDNVGATTIQAGVVTGTKISSDTITNSNINSAAAIAYSKLNLSASIVNADVATAAAIVITKIANGTANQLLGTNAGASANEWKTVSGTTNQITVTHGTGTITLATPQDIASGSSPTFAGLTLSSPLTVANGGTGKASLTAYAVLCGGTTATGAAQSIAAVGSSGQVLTSNGAAALPTFQDAVGSGTVGSGTAGRLTLYNASTNAVTDTYVQNTKNITLAIATQASRSANLALTIPNPGNAVTAANILLSEGAQTVNGVQTFTSVVKIGDGTLADPGLVFNSDSTTGLLTQLAGQVAISSGGTRTASFFTTSVRLGASPWELVGNSTAWTPVVDNSLTSGASGTRWANVYSVLGNFSGQLTADGATGNPIHGTNTNDSAAAGYVGETVLGNQGYTNFPTSTQWGDLTSISLTAGDWLVWGTYQLLGNGGTTTDFSIAITSTSGNSTTGFTNGLNNFSYRAASLTGSNEGQLTVSAVRFSLSSPATVYLKYAATWSTTAPQASGNIRALRIR